LKGAVVKVVIKMKMYRVAEMSKVIRPGDHVVAERSWGIVPYEHHGVYVGDGMVIDLADNVIGHVTLQEFSNGDDLWLRRYPSKHEFDAAEVVARATRRLGCEEYDLIDWNCEHFATWCVTGTAFSKQVHDVLWFDGYNPRGAQHSTAL
jgi:Lecithin retinol acyltransferase